MDYVVAMDLSTWQGMRSRDPRRLTLGSAQWGLPHSLANQHSRQPSDQELSAILARAKAAGVASIDTARAYGESEARIGHAITPGDGWRVLTRLGPDVHREGLDLLEMLECVGESLEASRNALQTDVLQTVLLDRFAHRHACCGRLWRRLLGERDAGRIGALGVSAATPEEAWAALEDPDIEVLQVASSLLDLRLYRQGFFPRARELGRTIYVRSIFLEGVGPIDPTTLPPSLGTLIEPVRAIAACAARVGVPSRALYLAFGREIPGAHPVLECETDAELEGLLADWASDTVDAATISQLVDTLPTLEAEAVDPSKWRGILGHDGESMNQTETTSIATMPI
jgi:aryl-alcohol dehydrogenase-like predicted oxidoreductase